jgi:hypothetical protein
MRALHGFNFAIKRIGGAVRGIDFSIQPVNVGGQ